MWLIKRFTKHVEIVDSDGIKKRSVINGISGYYPICDNLEDVVKISEEGKYQVLYITEDLDESLTEYDLNRDK